MLCDHFLATYSHVVKAKVDISERPWSRIESDRGIKHNHSFVSVPDAERSTTVTKSRNGESAVIKSMKIIITLCNYVSADPHPIIETTLANIRVLKTTKSSFENFHRDDYRTLPDAADRIFSTIIRTKWTYDRPQKVDFDKTASHIHKILLKNFAGEFPDGTNSPSVQNTMYFCGKEALESLPFLQRIEIEMPNVHYLTADFSKFPRLIQGQGPNLEVFVPTDKPAGNIFVEMKRDKVASKL